MVLPMPAMPMQYGPPSNYALSRRPLLVFVLTFQAIVCFMRIFLCLDIMGGFLMSIMIGMGFYAWRQEINITMIAYWGMLCLVNGVFDLVRFIDYAVKLMGPFMSSELSSRYNLTNLTMLLVPLSQLAGAPLAYFLFKDYAGNPEAAPIAGSAPGAPQAGFADPHRQTRQSQARGSTFSAFSGHGQRLGA